jgi:mRNA-degrading endonuclease toxin of MazEF toxin-antitoxin module
VKRGEIFWAELRPRSGSGQRGRRPVIVVSNDGFDLTAARRSVIVVPVKAGVAVCHRVATLDRTKLTERLGSPSPSALAAVEGGLKAALDLD